MSNRNPSARKSLRKYSKKLDVKHKTDVRRIGKAKTKHKATKADNVLWSNIAKPRGHKKINQKVREYLYRWVIHHPQVVQSSIANDCLYVFIDINNKKQFIPKFLLHGELSRRRWTKRRKGRKQ